MVHRGAHREVRKSRKAALTPHPARTHVRLEHRSSLCGIICKFRGSFHQLVTQVITVSTSETGHLPAFISPSSFSFFHGPSLLLSLSPFLGFCSTLPVSVFKYLAFRPSEGGPDWCGNSPTRLPLMGGVLIPQTVFGSGDT